MGIMNDRQIAEYATNEHMIKPFALHTGNGVISYGLSSFGYDMRLGPKLKVFGRAQSVDTPLIDPKNFNPDVVYDVEMTDYYDLPPLTYALGYSVEYFMMPRHTMGIVIGKSTYARCGLVVNCTPMEAGWAGHLTIELFNATFIPIRVYINEGIAQVVFHYGHPPTASYADRRGKYQDQIDEPITAKVLKGE